MKEIEDSFRSSRVIVASGLNEVKGITAEFERLIQACFLWTSDVPSVWSQGVCSG
jgi:hypothetical protein